MIDILWTPYCILYYWTGMYYWYNLKYLHQSSLQCGLCNNSVYFHLLRLENVCQCEMRKTKEIRNDEAKGWARTRNVKNRLLQICSHFVLFYRKYIFWGHVANYCQLWICQLLNIKITPQLLRKYYHVQFSTDITSLLQNGAPVVKSMIFLIYLPLLAVFHNA